MSETINERTIEITRVVNNGTESREESVGVALQETGVYTTEDGQITEVDLAGLEKGVKRAKSIKLGVDGVTAVAKDISIGRNNGRGVLTIGTGDRLVVQFNDRSLLRKPRRSPLRGL